MSEKQQTKYDPVEAFGNEIHLSFLKVKQALQKMLPDYYLMETEDIDFNLGSWLEHTKTSFEWVDEKNTELRYFWDRDEQRIAFPYFENGIVRLKFEGETVYTGIVTVKFGDCDEVKRSLIFGRNEAAARSFFQTVSSFIIPTDNAILIYDNGTWESSKKLKREISEATLDKLILTPGMKEEIMEDVNTFFASGELYHKLGISYRRGLLLLGPPGNGKTFTCKVIANASKRPFIYVRNFDKRESDSKRAISETFSEARKQAPCILCFEDLDSLINERLRSYFLNELDGFEVNDGVLCIASSNHPDQLDPALVHRPSRFDRKYQFDLPGKVEREHFLRVQLERLVAVGVLDAHSAESINLDGITQSTNGFSFAYLKELFVSASTDWVSDMARPYIDVLASACDKLKIQVRLAEDALSGKTESRGKPAVGFLGSMRSEK